MSDFKEAQRKAGMQSTTFRVKIDKNQMRKEQEHIRSAGKPEPEQIKRPSVVHARIPRAGTPDGKIDVNSDTWIYISQWAEKELAKSRILNDDLKKDGLSTSALRGEIKRLKALIALPEPAKERKLVEDRPPEPVLRGYQTNR